METNPMPGMKPVLIDEITDDVRALRGSDPEAQQKVLSARAMQDFFAGDDILITNPSDADFFNDDDKVDLDLVVVSGCRHLRQNSYVHGPKYAYNDTTALQEPLPGFLYTLAVLPSGDLLWSGGIRGVTNGGQVYRTLEEAGIEHRNLVPTPEGTSEITIGDTIRQVFWTHNNSLNDPSAYTRVGRYIECVDGKDVYEWGEWALLNGERMYIIVLDPTMREVENPIVNAVYSVHTSISEFKLPDPSNYKYGSTIELLQYPDPEADDRALWATYVTYDQVDEDKGINEKLRVLATPTPNRNTSSHEAAYLEGLNPTGYVFEVVPIISELSKEVIGKTWQLVVDAEETEFTTGVTGLLEDHTSPGVNDIVDYAGRRYYEENVNYPSHAADTLVINRAMPCSGYVKGVVTKRTSALASGWTVVVKALASDTPANFEVTTHTSPRVGVMYFVRVEVSDPTQIDPSTGRPVTVYSYQLATDPSNPSAEPGYPSTFDTATTYYTLKESATSIAIKTVTSDQMKVGEEIHFGTYLPRHYIVYISIRPGIGQNHIAARDHANMSVSISPDPHQGSYLHRSKMASGEFTASQYQRSCIKGDIPIEAGDTTADKVPAAVQTVFNSHQYLAEKLAKKGLLLGAVDCGNLSDGALDTTVQSGSYWFIPSGVLTEKYDNTGYPAGTQAVLSKLIVFGGDAAPANMTHEEDQYFITEDETPTETKLYYTFNTVTNDFELAGDGGTVIGSFVDQYKPYYEKKSSGILTDKRYIIQIMMQNGQGPRMWFRFGNRTGIDPVVVAWSKWTQLNIGDYHQTRQAADVPESDFVEAFAHGNPVFTVGISPSVIQKVNLPSPENYPVGTKLIFKVKGDEGTTVKFIYTDAAPVPAGGTAVGHEYSHVYEGTLGNYDQVEFVNDGIYWYHMATSWER